MPDWHSEGVLASSSLVAGVAEDRGDVDTQELHIKRMAEVFVASGSPRDVEGLLAFLFSPKELSWAADRWRVFCVLHHSDLPDRQVADVAGVSIGKVTRAKKALKKAGSTVPPLVGELGKTLANQLINDAN